jgi:hypothetical protein
MSDPPVSVLMSVHNGVRFLREAVDSILSQTWANFEFLGIDDGSTDGSGALLDKLARRDPRMRVIHQENMGLTKSLNRGLALARGDLVARMDGDDVSEPTRLEVQMGYLAKHPEIAVLGTSDTMIDGDGRVLRHVGRTVDPMVVRWELSYGNSVVHSSVMFRRGLVRAAGGYNSEFAYAQDYELWTRLLMGGAGISSTPQTLLKYRISGNNVFMTRRQEQENCALKAGHRYIEHLLQHQVPEEEVSQMRLILGRQRLSSIPLWRNAVALCDELLVRAGEECSPRQVKELRMNLSDAFLDFARLNARAWPAHSLRSLRRSLSLLPRRALDKRAIGAVLLYGLWLVRRVKIRVKSAAQSA